MSNANTELSRDLEIVRATPERTRTRLTVQLELDAQTADSRTLGHEAIHEVAAEADLEDDAVQSCVVLSDEKPATLVTEVGCVDTTCVGATGSSAVAQSLDRSITERVAQVSTGTAIPVRGEQRVPRTVRQAVI